MAAINVTGTVIKCEVRKTVAVDFNYTHKYSPNTEHYTIRLNVCIQTADGKRFFFDSPSWSMDATSVPGATVVTFCPDQKDSESWFVKNDGNGVATAEKANTNDIIPTIKVGDTLSIRASVKAEKPTYTSLNRVKMLKA